MKRERIFAVLMLAAAAASCTPKGAESPEVGGEALYATVEAQAPVEVQSETPDAEPQSKTPYAATKVLISGTALSWESGDRISVFPRTTACVPYDFQGVNTEGRGRFTSTSTPGSGSALDATYALYPHASSNSVSAEGKLSYTFPQEQQYRASSFGPGANPMVAKTTDNTLQFKNIGGCFVLRLQGPGLKISSVTLSGNNGEIITGKATVTLGSGDIPTVSMASGGGKSLKLVCPSPVTLGSSGSTDFWFVLPPTVFSKGITVSVITSDGAAFERKSANKLEIKRSRITASKPLQVNILEHVSYTASTSAFANPERGFYTAYEFNKDSASSLSSSSLAANRTAGETLVLLEYYMPSFVKKDISDKYISLMEKNFKALRSAGVKCILRYAYSDSEDNHPYDPTESQVLRHIEQLTGLLQTYSDVIYVMQAGFVGVWGEWYYTDNFIQGPKSDDDYLPRKHVLDALLQALPEDRQIEVRTPTFKMRMYGKSLSDTITVKTAFNGSTTSRVAGHNDCFLADSNDMGTFQNDTERKYWKAETRYTIMGGETCTLSDYCSCKGSSGKPGAIKSLEDYHYSYLHSGYNKSVLNRWKSEECWDEIDRRLGYRIVLEEGWFTANPAAGGEYTVRLKLRNDGFASMMNERPAFLELTDANGNDIQSWELGSDPRTWRPWSGSITIEKTITLPANASGNCKLWLNLPDASDLLCDKPAYSVRLANENVWDNARGYNLLRTINL